MSTRSLKPGWKMVKFGDIAQNVAVRVDPADAKTDVYVGLEHLDPSTIHLRQWGHPSDVTGQKLAFKKGDVIFGRRRAYQRKLAVAEFDGICSAHAMVVRAKPKMIQPEFLPFFLQSDMFMERAIEISVGSLSPTINWKTLREQVFPLPPLDEQKRIAEILWAADEVLEKYESASNAITNVFESSKKVHFGKEHNAHFRDVLSLASGKSKTKKQQFEFSSENPVPVYGGNGITGYTTKALVDGPVVIIGRVGEYCGAVHLSDENCWVTDNAIYVKEYRSEIETTYLYYALIYASLNSQKRIAGQPLINQEIIESSTLYLPSIDEQREVLSRLSEIKQRKQEIEAHIFKTSLILKSLGCGFTQIGAAHV